MADYTLVCDALTLSLTGGSILVQETVQFAHGTYMLTGQDVTFTVNPQARLTMSDASLHQTVVSDRSLYEIHVSDSSI